MNKLVLVGTIPDDAKASFREIFNGQLEVEDVATPDEAVLIKDAVYLVLRGVKFPKEKIEALSDSVKYITRWGVGYDSVDIEAAGKRGITVTICTGGNAQPVAELAMTLMLASLRKLPQLIDRAKEGSDKKNDITDDSYLLQGKTVGLLGIGNIGSKVAKMVQGFGATVQYFDAFRWSEEREKEANITYVDVDTLLRTSDILSIHVPLLPSTEGMLNKEAFAKMKPTAIVVNTARGPIINTEALLEAVNSGQIRGAALDTIDGEPLAPDHEVFQNPRIILTPHAGGNTCDNTPNMVNIVTETINSAENGTGPAPRYIVNSQYLA